MRDNIEHKASRILWIDLFKGLGIFLVVLGHSGIPIKLSWWIWSFHMPMFFFISGFLFNRDSNKVVWQFFKKRIKTLILPYSFFTLLALLCILYLNKYSEAKIEVINIFESMHILLWGWKGLALWFIPVLFFVELFFLIITKVFKSKVQLSIVLLFSAILGYFLGEYQLRLPYKMEVVFAACTFYGLGSVYKEDILKFLENKRATALLYLCIVAFLLNFITCFYNTSKLDMCFNQFGNFFLTYIAAISGSLAFVIFSFSLFKSQYRNSFFTQAIVFLGKNTLIILGTHQILKFVLNIGFQNLSPNPFLVLLKHMLFWVLLVVVVKIFNRYFYFFLGKNKSF